MKGKFLASTAGASVILALLSIFSKGISFFREIIYANNFGLSREYDIFLSCAAIPIVINTGFIYLTQHYFIPAYNQKEADNKKKEAFFNFNFWAFILFGCGLSFVLFLFSDLIINSFLSGLTEEQKYTGMKIFLIFLLTIPLNAGISVISAYMQAEFQFIIPAFILIFLNIIIIVIVLLFSSFMQIMILPYAFFIAYFFSLIFITIPVWRLLKFNKASFLEDRKTSSYKELLILIVIEFTSLSYVIHDRYFINHVTPGGISALNYALIIFSLPITIFSISLVTAIFSKFSLNFISSKDELRNNLKTSTGVTAFVMVPVTVVMFFLGGEFLEVFYQRGSFSAENTLLTYNALQYYLFGLIFYSEYLIIVKVYYSMNKYKEIMILSCAAVVLKILFNFLLVNPLSQNGLAFSTSLIYLFLFISSIYWLKKSRLEQSPYFIFGQIIYFCILAFVAYSTASLLTDLTDLNLIFKWGMFSSVYLLSSYIFKDREFKIFLDLFKIIPVIKFKLFNR